MGGHYILVLFHLMGNRELAPGGPYFSMKGGVCLPACLDFQAKGSVAIRHPQHASKSLKDH
jgi:hypothetical protein